MAEITQHRARIFSGLQALTPEPRAPRLARDSQHPRSAAARSLACFQQPVHGREAETDAHGAGEVKGSTPSSPYSGGSERNSRSRRRAQLAHGKLGGLDAGRRWCTPSKTEIIAAPRTARPPRFSCDSVITHAIVQTPARVPCRRAAPPSPTTCLSVSQLRHPLPPPPQCKPTFCRGWDRQRGCPLPCQRFREDRRHLGGDTQQTAAHAHKPRIPPTWVLTLQPVRRGSAPVPRDPAHYLSCIVSI